jgi:hypothetical protein
MNEWGFISQDTLVVLESSATNCKFINRCGFEQMARLVLSNSHSSSPSIVNNKNDKL